MKKLTLILIMGVLTAVCYGKGVKVVENGKSKYTISVATAGDSISDKAANMLQHYVNKISGAELKINHKTSKGKTISLRQNSSLHEDGFKIYLNGEQVIVEGGAGYGVLYGVQELLESQWGVRKYSDVAEVVPSNSSLILDQNYKTEQTPVITGRNLFYNNVRTSDYMDWLRLTQKPNSSVNRGRWGMWVHTFGTLVNPDKYFATHPQYYTLDADGKRSPSQLCLSNEEVVDVICAELVKRMAAKPEAIYWSVSQNDNQNYCRCPDCVASYEKEGSPSGITIEFVNKIAKRFPDKHISTLAYQYTRKAPLHAKPLPNVNIMFCNIECGRNLPIDEDPTSASFCKDMENWGELTNNIILWDYIVQFSNLYTPFPNFYTLGPNMKYFVTNNVTSLFSQGSPEPATEMTHLRAYVSGKLLWNPNVNVDSLVNDFIYGYYGAAADHIRGYFDALHAALAKSGERLDIFGDAIEPRYGYLSPENVANYQTFFEKAESAVANDPELLKRVQFARAPLYFVELEQSHVDPYSKTGYLIKKDGKTVINKAFYDRLNKFIEILKANGSRKLCEWATPVETYKTELDYIPAQWIEMTDNKNLASGCNVEYIVKSLDNYDNLLTNNFLGSRSFGENWVKVKKDKFEFVVDLGSEKAISEVKIRFAQSILDNILMPYGYKVFTSTDGLNYVESGSVNVPMDEKTNYKFAIFTAPAKAQARYVKIVGDVIGDLPLWHRDAGRPCATLLDEIAIF